MGIYLHYDVVFVVIIVFVVRFTHYIIRGNGP